MKFKTDENVHPSVAVHLRSRGFDALTVWDQAVDGYADDPLLTLCTVERRALVTLDRDFSDIRRYPPPTHQGIIVLRVSEKSAAGLIAAVDRWLAAVGTEPLERTLWTVDDNRVRLRR